jgi:hypothetical protein
VNQTIRLGEIFDRLSKMGPETATPETQAIKLEDPITQLTTAVLSLSSAVERLNQAHIEQLGHGKQ